jgi:hypothetical protein
MEDADLELVAAAPVERRVVEAGYGRGMASSSAQISDETLDASSAYQALAASLTDGRRGARVFRAPDAAGDAVAELATRAAALKVELTALQADFDDVRSACDVCVV